MLESIYIIYIYFIFFFFEEEDSYIKNNVKGGRCTHMKDLYELKNLIIDAIAINLITVYMLEYVFIITIKLK